MSKEDWAENTLPNIFKRANLWPWKEGEIVSVLDVACGLALKSKYIPAQIRVGVDIYEPYFEHIESDVPYVVIKQDVRKLRDIFVPKSFDLVIACDILEHLEKHETEGMLDQLEQIAKKAVLVECPKGFIPQDMDILGHGGDHWQTHRSAWEPEDLEKRGYKVLIRDYLMSNKKRHSTITDIDPHVQMLDAVKFIG